MASAIEVTFVLIAKDGEIIDIPVAAIGANDGNSGRIAAATPASDGSQLVFAKFNAFFFRQRKKFLLVFARFYLRDLFFI